jgi:hypothetical protein
MSQEVNLSILQYSLCFSRQLTDELEIIAGEAAQRNDIASHVDVSSSATRGADMLGSVVLLG